MKTKNFITGVLNNFKLFYGNVEFSYDDSEEVYEALKQYASKEMLKSKEMNVGKEIVKNPIIFKGCEQFYDCLRLSI